MTTWRTIAFGLLLGLLVPGGAQWHAQRFLAGAVFLACAIVIALFAYPRFGWISLPIAPTLALLEQLLCWRARANQKPE
ncbi:putative membrane-bound mannosyltransferase [Crossiella equi]|uniref:Membrane-bound mannosyltransferase n=1 Tax=Crossiella equi TaxID=130796 RepID=A0ABS5AM58_9PSEU|nr:hypothetical protein [Crossiella equi]MBP2477660.1 putative membrane-bound mannosyltransferase [Crossiella equi]